MAHLERVPLLFEKDCTDPAHCIDIRFWSHRCSEIEEAVDHSAVKGKKVSLHVFVWLFHNWLAGLVTFYLIC